MTVLEPLKATGAIGRYDALVTLKGGGPGGQVDAVKLGDAREVERKKYGLHKARRAPQYSKR